jgi:signal transduction histidine kinase
MEAAFQTDIDAIQSIDAVTRILEVVCRTTGMGFSAVARVTEDRWICCAVRDEISFGIAPGGELKVQTTICNEIRYSLQPVVIDNVDSDEVFCDHPTPALYGFKSYVSLPIILANGRMFGTLCAIDPRPAKVNTPQTIGMFKLFAELIAFHLDAIHRLQSSEASLQDERRTSELRDQFIAVLGHDLRNPLASISAGINLLKRNKPEAAPEILRLMGQSVIRMTTLITNVLDFARGRLGDGLHLQKESHDLAPFLDHVVSELQSAFPDRIIVADFNLTQPVNCDASRMGQLFSNLLGNALTYGAPDQPVRVAAKTSDGQFELAVANTGDPIAPESFARLFQPFSRGTASNQQGLGLGLYIASEIARAHGGTIDAVSTQEETRFTLRMPVA